jgi:hypothetical protein
MSQLFEVSAEHRQRKEDCKGVTTCLPVRCELCLGNLLYGNKAEGALDELLSTPRKHEPLFLGPCVRDLGRGFRFLRQAFRSPSGWRTSVRAEKLLTQ